MTAEYTTGLIVPVSRLSSELTAFRQQHDSSARQGMPPHVTILFPFLSSREVDARVLAHLESLFAAQHEFDFRLTEIRRFPGILYLAPEPAEPFKRLTDAVVDDYPDYPPYGDPSLDVIPHMTVADPGPGERMNILEAQLRQAAAGSLPLVDRATAVHLFTLVDGRWVLQIEFPLGVGRCRTLSA
jgi:2'-5' RNA ligase